MLLFQMGWMKNDKIWMPFGILSRYVETAGGILKSTWGKNCHSFATTSPSLSSFQSTFLPFLQINIAKHKHSFLQSFSLCLLFHSHKESAKHSCCSSLGQTNLFDEHKSVNGLEPFHGWLHLSLRGEREGWFMSNPGTIRGPIKQLLINMGPVCPMWLKLAK